MKIKRQSLRQRGLALIAVIILVGAILVIAGSIIYMLYKLCKKCLPPPGDGGGTNNIVRVFDYESVNNFADGTSPIQLPALVFPKLAKPQGWTEENPFGWSWMELQRCTNINNPVWETIAKSTNAGHVLCMENDDTNPPPDRAFYRGKFVYP